MVTIQDVSFHGGQGLFLEIAPEERLPRVRCHNILQPFLHIRGDMGNGVGILDLKVVQCHGCRSLGSREGLQDYHKQHPCAITCLLQPQIEEKYVKLKGLC